MASFEYDAQEAFALLKQSNRDNQQVQYQNLPFGLDALPFIRDLAQELLSGVYDWSDKPREFLTHTLNPQFGGTPKTYKELKALAESEYKKGLGEVFPSLEFNDFLEFGYRVGLFHKNYSSEYGIESRERTVYYELNPEAFVMCSGIELNSGFAATEKNICSLNETEKGILLSISVQHALLKDDLIEIFLGECDPQMYDALYDSFIQNVHTLEQNGYLTSKPDDFGGVVLVITERGERALEDPAVENTAS